MTKAYLYPSPSLGLEETHFELDRPSVSVGRHPRNDISLLLDSVSRQHARFDESAGQWVLTDLGSSNGTFLNGERLQATVILREQDLVTLGRADFLFSVVGPEAGGGAAVGQHTSSVNLVNDDVGQSTILSTQISSETTPFQVAKVAQEQHDVEALEAITQRLMTLYRLSDLLRSATNRQEVLSNVMDLLFEVLPADRGVILTIEGIEGELEPQFVRFRDEEDSKELNISRTIVQKCLNERVAILSRDAKVDSRFSGSESILASDIRSAMCLPLLSKRSLIGVLFLDANATKRAFSEDDLSFASSLANELALTLDNLSLAQENIHNERLAAVGQTIAGLAHNIKNILQLARGGLELMDGAIQKKSLEEIGSFWPVVRRGIDRMQSLTQEMLDYSRQTAPELVEADVNVVLQELIETFRQDSVEDGVAIDLKTTPELPARRIDPDGLNKAIMNLLSNAVDAFDGGPGEIIISSSVARDTILIRVQDDGRGIPKEKLSRIFQPFFTTKGSKGTGLGLSMTRKYIEDMAGTISVESQEGAGTTFTIALPPLSTEIAYDLDDLPENQTDY